MISPECFSMQIEVQIKIYVEMEDGINNECVKEVRGEEKKTHFESLSL